jgi:hypothetical protein
MSVVKVTWNRARGFTWVCLLGAVRMAVICLTLMTLKLKFSSPLEISSAGVSGGKVTNYCLDRLFGIWGEGKIVEIIFLQVGLHS